eukprot:9048540-Prorocentrum_lima.AAC.1
MTSSLVGSEMCIRDRHLGCGDPLRGCGWITGGRWRRNRWCRCARRPAPVSYTHLTLPTICSV